MPIQTNPPEYYALSFERAIAIKQLGFRYSPSHPWVPRNLSIDVLRNSPVVLTEITGSGKSTLLEVIMGLLTPTEGVVLTDGNALTELNTRAWQAHISHVPQAIFYLTQLLLKI